MFLDNAVLPSGSFGFNSLRSTLFNYKSVDVVEASRPYAGRVCLGILSVVNLNLEDRSIIRHSSENSFIFCDFFIIRLEFFLFERSDSSRPSLIQICYCTHIIRPSLRSVNGQEAKRPEARKGEGALSLVFIEGSNS